MNLLLLSNSILPGGSYLQYAIDSIYNHCAGKKKCLFIPYAGVTISWDDYLQKVKTALSSIPISISGIHQYSDPLSAIIENEVIIVGGGNTYRLLQLCRQNNILSAIKEKIAKGSHYIGWSAGANLACPTICTTNDMPIIDPKGFEALGLIYFQINPHYNNELPAGHQGETRSQRLLEYLEINKNIKVLGLPEGNWLECFDVNVTLFGNKSAVLFEYGKEIKNISAGNINFINCL